MKNDLASQDLQKRIKKSIWWSLIALGVIAVGIMVFLFTAKISLFAISGSSMEPTLHDRDSIILKQEKSVMNGQIFIFNKPSSWGYMGKENSVLVKRIGATPGQTLEFDGKSFLVDGESIYNLADDNYECKDGKIGFSHTLSKSEIFALGDNPLHSLDSRRIFCDGDIGNIFVPYKSMIDYGHIAAKF